MFADDTAMLGTRKELYENNGMDVASNEVKKFGQKENMEKREWIEMGKKNDVRVLGAYMDLEVDTSKRFRKGNLALIKTKKRLKGSTTIWRRQAKVLRALVMTTILYACKSRPWREREIRKPQQVMDKGYRYITKTNRWKMNWQEESIYEIRKKIGATRIEREIEKMALDWYGHIMRMPESKMLKQTMKGWLDNKEGKMGKV